MPTLCCSIHPDPSRANALDLGTLQRTMRAPAWRKAWRVRAVDGLIRHDAVPGLMTGPGFELHGDPRGIGWLEVRLADAPDPATARLALQRMLEVTRRPWGIVAWVPAELTAPVQLRRQERDARAGRRLAEAAVEDLLNACLSR